MKTQILSIVIGLILILPLSISAPEVQSADQPITTEPTDQKEAKPILRDLSPLSIIRLFYQDEQLRAYFAPSKEQIDQFEKLFEELENEARALQTKYAEQQITPELAESRKKELVNLQKKFTDGFTELLSPKELKSFNIVRFQILGGFISPMANVELLSIFDLSKAQAEQIDALVKERQGKLAAVSAILNQRPNSQEEAREQIMQVRQQGMEISKEYGKKIQEVLNQDQQAQAEKWLQESVELRKLFTLARPTQSGQR